MPGLKKPCTPHSPRCLTGVVSVGPTLLSLSARACGHSSRICASWSWRGLCLKPLGAYASLGSHLLETSDL